MEAPCRGKLSDATAANEHGIDENRSDENTTVGCTDHAMDTVIASAGNRALKDVLSRNWSPAGLRQPSSYVEVEYEMSERHACRLLGLGRSTDRYRTGRSATPSCECG